MTDVLIRIETFKLDLFFNSEDSSCIFIRFKYEQCCGDDAWTTIVRLIKKMCGTILVLKIHKNTDNRKNISKI
jgi:hypothetical protein